MKKKFLMLALLLTLGFGCEKDKEEKGIAATTTPIKPNIHASKFLLRGDFENEDAYVIFTNEDAMKKSVIERINIRDDSGVSKTEKSQVAMNLLNKYNNSLNLREKERELVEANKERTKDTNKAKNLKLLKAEEIKTEKEGDEAVFNNYVSNSYGGDDEVKTTAKLIKQVKTTSGEDRVLNIWMDESLITETSLTDYHIDDLADSFLKEGKNNDIYEYVTAIYGKEWYDEGDNIEEGVIGATETIDILLSQLNTNYNSFNGITLGFYYAVNNFIADPNNETFKDSNERVMFYLDSKILKEDKQEIISTLAHEFVHTINFYQKSAKQGSWLEPWLNEMMAMVGEDLVADKMKVSGPRGIADVASTQPTEEEKDAKSGRFYAYNSADVNTLPINDLDGNFDVKNYSQTYAYGAYLIRNMIKDGDDFKFLRNINNNIRTGHEAIEYALNVAGINKTFEETVKDFAKATLLSDNKFTGNEMYKYNVGRTFDQSGMEFKIGPINVHNYVRETIPGFVTFKTNYDKAPIMSYGGVQYFKLGEGLNGDKSFELTVPDGVEYQVVVKDANGNYDEEKSKELEKNMLKMD